MRKFLSFILITLLFSACKTKPAVVPVVEIKEPEFEIVSILVLQADLVNTQFETVLKITNPNQFAVELSSINYELHGNGRLWAEGAQEDIFQIPAESSCETVFNFSMNFINMTRGLLDDIIALRKVNYHFKGNAEVKPDIPRIRPFSMKFDCSGLSDVKQRSDKNQPRERDNTRTIRPTSPQDEFGDW